jgi:peptide-methionine (S)-S-oxide reductase
VLSAAVMSSFFSKLTRNFSLTSPTLRFAPEQTARMDVPDGAQKCTLAAGCFWGVEHMYRKDFGGKGLLDARVGYIGGDTKSPSYRAVCSGSTGRES